MITSMQMIERRRSRESMPMEHDRRRPDPQAHFSRLRAWETAIVAGLLLVLALVFSAAGHATEVCKPQQVQTVNANDEHGYMCFETARVLVQLVRDSGLPCDMVIGSILNPAKRQYLVTCRVLDMTQRADRAVRYINYASVDGRAFRRIP